MIDLAYLCNLTASLGQTTFIPKKTETTMATVQLSLKIVFQRKPSFFVFDNSKFLITCPRCVKWTLSEMNFLVIKGDVLT